MGTTEMSLERQHWKEGIRRSLNCFAIIICLHTLCMVLSLCPLSLIHIYIYIIYYDKNQEIKKQY